MKPKWNAITFELCGCWGPYGLITLDNVADLQMATTTEPTLHFHNINDVRVANRSLLGTTTKKCCKPSGTANCSTEEHLPTFLLLVLSPVIFIQTGSFKLIPANLSTPAIKRTYQVVTYSVRMYSLETTITLYSNIYSTFCVCWWSKRVTRELVNIGVRLLSQLLTRDIALYLMRWGALIEALELS